MIKNLLQEFVDYCKKLDLHDEKSHSQTFLNNFFIALGFQGGALDTGGNFEERIKDGKTTKYADFAWRKTNSHSGVLIEMKKRDTDLSLHYQQALEYWFRLVPNRPQFVILCNFDEFWIYDFNLKVSDPVDILKLEELATRHQAISFLFPKPQIPVFNKDRQDVTEIAVEQVGYAFNSLVRGQNRRKDLKQEDALRYCLQCVVAMFAEDVELLHNNIFTRIIEECEKQTGTGFDKVPLSFDLIGGLFREMNTQGITEGGRYRGVDYFNGGLFDKIIPIELTKKEIEYFETASQQNWRNVNPAIFGSLFEGLMQSKERHKLGAHYTHESDIMKIVDPVIVRPWRKKIEDADTLDELYELITQLRNFKVLDPACGSGNFLFVAYREMKNLEKQLLNRIRSKSTKSEDAKRLTKFLSTNHYVSTKQFFGIDIKPDAVELAKVTLMVAKELWYLQTTDKDFDKENALPLDNLDQNIICADSLVTEWYEADAIIGNPPYQSKNKMQVEFGADYVNKLYKSYPEIPGRADFCVYWFYKAHQHLKENAYAGLVGTNTIRQNYSREGSLDYIVKNGGTIIEAVSSERWGGDAAVHVSIACWKKGKQNGEKNLYVADEQGNLILYKIPFISSSLSLKTDVTSAKNLECNKEPKKCFQGQTHGHDGFLLSISEAKKILKENKKYSNVLKPFLIGEELLSGVGAQPSRYVIDFDKLEINEASSYSKLFEIVKKKVLPKRKQKANEQEIANKELLLQSSNAKVNKHHINFYNYWWQLSYSREDMLGVIKDLSRYISVSRRTLRPIFEFISKEIRPNDAMIVFAFDDDYSFGIIQSSIHWKWFIEKGGTLGETPAYTPNSVWNTFPFPQTPTQKQIEKVAKCAKALRDARNKAMKEHHYSLRDLYRILEQPGKNLIKDLHAELDEAVLDAYNFDVPQKEESVKAKKKKPKETRETNCDCIADIKDSPLPPFYYENTEEEDGIDEFHESDVIYQTKKRQKLLSLDMLEKLLELNLLIHEREKQGKKVQAPGLPDWVKDKEKFVTDDCVRFEE